MGYVDMGGTCVPMNAGGAGGAGGGGPRCTASQCPCFLLSGIFPCCTTFDTCGCTFAPGAYCFQTGP